MPMTDIDRVRLKIADKAALRRETWDADGTTQDVRLEYAPVLASPPLQAWKNNVLINSPADYSVDLASGIVTLTALPTVDDTFVFQYSSVVFSDEEIQDTLDHASSSVRLAAHHLLYAWAADAAKLAVKESRSGGGGLGSITIDTSVRAREMRATADAYMKEYQEFEGTGLEAEYLTEVAWTESSARRMVINDALDNLR